jgi:hypothetical protein
MEAKMTYIFKIQDAVLSARKRMADRRIGIQVRHGLAKIILTEYPDGTNSKITAISGWMMPEMAIEYLNRMSK